MRNFIVLVVVAVSLLFVLESRSSADPDIYKSQPAHIVIANKSMTHELVLTGEKVKNRLFIEEISVSSLKGAGEVKFIPEDMVSIRESGMDLTQSWSPDGDFLVLPVGRFDGFTVFSVQSLPKALSDGIGQSSVAIEGSNRSKWWHEFDGWKDAKTIKFRAGLSGYYFRFEWNVESGDVKALDLAGEGCIVVTRTRMPGK